MRNNQWVKRLSAAAVAASLLTIPAMALEFPDTQGHWGQGAIERWSDYGVLEGANGLFNPDSNMTRAELAAVISRLLGLRRLPKTPSLMWMRTLGTQKTSSSVRQRALSRVPARAQTRTAP